MIAIREPLHGAVLNYRHGKVSGDGLQIVVRGTAPVSAAVTVNGVHASRVGEEFEAEVVLRGHDAEILAATDGVRGRSEHRVRVVWDRNSRPRYCFGIDDNSFFPRDIAAKKYKSLFDCFYLKGLRDLHQKYRSKFVLNLFYTTPEGDFDLSKFPATYKGEWADNADWLRLAFHAYAEFPDRPYQHATAEKLAKDFDLVAGEALRFAGAQSWTPPAVIHWGGVHYTGFPVLVQRGVKVLSGSFVADSGSGYTTDGAKRPVEAMHGYDVNYGLDNLRSEYMSRHDAMKDFDTGMVFVRTDIVCNNTPVEKVVPTLAPLTADPNMAEIMNLFTHEQYFWPFYFNYRPDHFQRLDATFRFCTERGYEPVFLQEGFLGVPE